MFKCLSLIALLFISNNTITVKASLYHANVPQQGWGDGSTTASGDRIPIKELKQGSIKWLSISRDLHTKYGGRYKFDDTITVCGNNDYCGKWVVKDLMNKRYTKRIDFLQHSSNKKVPPTTLTIY